MTRVMQNAQRHAVRGSREVRPPFVLRGGTCNLISKRQSRQRSFVTKAAFGGTKEKQSSRQTIVPEPSYAIPSVLGGLAVGSALAGGRLLPAVEAILALFLAFQASRVRFRFEADALEVVLGEKESKSENKFVGGENRWKYDSFVNWEFWWPNFPVLVYFKETQTKPEGQIHFFPCIFDGRQVYDVMVERCGKSKNSAPSN